MMPEYDRLLLGYEVHGIIPSTNRLPNDYVANLQECPWCKKKFAIAIEGTSIVHCPHCCMEVMYFND